MLHAARFLSLKWGSVIHATRVLVPVSFSRQVCFSSPNLCPHPHWRLCDCCVCMTACGRYGKEAHCEDKGNGQVV